MKRAYVRLLLHVNPVDSYRQVVDDPVDLSLAGNLNERHTTMGYGR